MPCKAGTLAVVRTSRTQKAIRVLGAGQLLYTPLWVAAGLQAAKYALWPGRHPTDWIMLEGDTKILFLGSLGALWIASGVALWSRARIGVTLAIPLYAGFLILHSAEFLHYWGKQGGLLILGLPPVWFHFAVLACVDATALVLLGAELRRRWGSAEGRSVSGAPWWHWILFAVGATLLVVGALSVG